MPHLIIPGNVEGTIQPGETLLCHLQRMRVRIASHCTGRGECEACRVRIISGGENLSPLSDIESAVLRHPDERLACQGIIMTDRTDIVIEPLSPMHYQILEDGFKRDLWWHPSVERIDDDGGAHISRRGQIIGEYAGELFGIAIDVGTTTIVMRWLDLEEPDLPAYASHSILNPQIVFGDNIIDRIAYARSHPGGETELRQILVETLNRMIHTGPVYPEHVYEAVIVGNTVMRDLGIGHSVLKMGTYPYDPQSLDAVNCSPESAGIRINPGGNIYAPPLLGHFVGADMLAVILATGMAESPEISMAIDIGTNTEIAIGNEDRILVTSCASGPAFEGAGIRWGTGAIEGAIQEIVFEPGGTVSYRTIGGAPPSGICGSGLIDALAGMIDKGFMDRSGKFTRPLERCIIVGGDTPIFLDEQDIDNLKLAKSAVSAGTRILMNRFGAGEDDISTLFLAGAFGSRINPDNAVKIGILPFISRDRIVIAGNAALEGATAMLVSEERRRCAERLVEICSHISIETENDFFEKFVEGLCFCGAREDE